MNSLKQQLTHIVSEAFTTAGYSAQYGEVVISQRPDLGDYQCNGALPAAKPYQKNPRQIAQEVVALLQNHPWFTEVSIAGAGFINLRLHNDVLVNLTQEAADDDSGRLGVPLVDPPLTILVDFGGPNVAKALHVGHLRTAIIGESVRRLCQFLGHHTIGDIHMGDWGLQMGQIIVELQQRQPALPYFEASYSGPYPAESPVTIEDLEEIYPIASAKSKSDPEFLAQAQTATSELQNRRPGYWALWKHFVAVSVADLKKNYDALDVHFDLWLGESDVQDLIIPLVQKLTQDGVAIPSEGALVIPITEPTDKKEMPPLMLVKSNESVGYEATDLATIQQRVRDYNPDAILYVVDGRQQDHFQKVFRAAYKGGIADKNKVSLEHNYFGTMNGTDGKPFKTRSGGTIKLQDLIDLVVGKAYERMSEAQVADDYPAEERDDIARKVGIAALKYADMMNHRTIDYVFDLDRFSSFEGRTGPYLLYTAVRTRSILRKAAEQGLAAGRLVTPAGEEERDVLLKLLQLPDALEMAFANRAPNYLCDYAYTLAALFNRFYRQHHILTETNPAQQASWLKLCELTVLTLSLTLDLLGIGVPERM